MPGSRFEEGVQHHSDRGNDGVRTAFRPTVEVLVFHCARAVDDQLLGVLRIEAVAHSVGAFGVRITTGRRRGENARVRSAHQIANRHTFDQRLQRRFDREVGVAETE